MSINAPATPGMTQPNHLPDLLKQILENLRSPERLDAHPWAGSLTVQAAAAENPALASKSPGAQLVLTMGELFRQMMPTTPPQQYGKRLDTRWGRFGMLAANYFAPLFYGRQYPRSLRDAWRRIDQSILLFVYGLPADQLKPDQVKAYQLLGDEGDLAANSTISDWHREGLQELTDSFVAREKSLSLSLGKPSALIQEGDDRAVRKVAGKPARISMRRWTTCATLAGIVLVGVLIGMRGYRAYERLQLVRQDLTALTAADVASMQPETLKQFGAILAKTHADLVAAQLEVAPFFWLTRQLGWIPVYGGDLKYAEAMVATAVGATDAANQADQAAMPVWDAIHQQQNLKASQLTQMLVQTGPALLEAQATLGQAMEARRRIRENELSPGTRELLTRVDPYLSTLNEMLTMALSVPSLLGGTDSGPKTYLILVENEDELRPTGGFITSVGKAVVWNGELVNLSIEDSYNVDDITKTYPAAPWQLQSFMNVPIMVFRDASWFTDYPTAVRWAEYLYAYTNSYSVDGVIAVDQHVLEKVLSITGPVYVPAINITVTADNVRTVMRAQKAPPPPEHRDPEWQRKQFMNPITSAILDRWISGTGISWEQLLQALMDELDQRHIMVQLDDPSMTKLLADRGWDGAVRNDGGDFLMAVDTNVGYNKTNAVVSSRLSYDVDLTQLASPASSLTVHHQNDAEGPAGPCLQRPVISDSTTAEAWYPIDRCYYNYLRIYVPAGTQLTAATPHAVTRDEMLFLDQDVPARVDLLDEKIANVQGFGTLMVVPMKGSLDTSFHFNLPATVVQTDAGGRVYHLKIQKQAGMVTVPVTLRIHLPPGSTIVSANPAYVQDGASLVFNLDLQTDLDLRIGFRP